MNIVGKQKWHYVSTVDKNLYECLPEFWAAVGEAGLGGLLRDVVLFGFWCPFTEEVALLVTLLGLLLAACLVLVAPLYRCCLCERSVFCILGSSNDVGGWCARLWYIICSMGLGLGWCFCTLCCWSAVEWDLQPDDSCLSMSDNITFCPHLRQSSVREPQASSWESKSHLGYSSSQ